MKWWPGWLRRVGRVDPVDRVVNVDKILRGPRPSTELYPELSANAALTLLVVACTLLDRQVSRLAVDFETKGGFTEHLYRVRTAKRRTQR